jgi:hypothetical protein
MAQNQVFISYAWGGESETVANELEIILQNNGIDLVRDKSDLGFKGLIREFMQQIGMGNLVVLVISDKYLKSKNCMFELMEVEKKGEFFDRIFPIVLPDANIYDSLGILSYLKYWDQKIKELNASAKELDNLADTRKVQEDINLYTDIRGAIDDLAGKLSNMNTLTLEIMRSKSYQPLIDALLTKKDKAPLFSPSAPAKKEGKVLYHIPGMMQVNAWSRCTVRLAWEDIYLTEGLKIPEDQQVIESIRLGNVMQVSLNEGRDGHNFEIKALNNEEQFIFEDDFTEWLFDVKALSMGNFTLILRVTLIQIIEGKERKKDVVLERNVVTEAVVPKALARFETAEEGLQVVDRPDFSTLEKSQSSEVNAQYLPPATPKPIESIFQQGPQAAPAPPKSISIRRLMPYAASFLVLLTAGVLIFGGGIQSGVAEYNGTATVDSLAYIVEESNGFPVGNQIGMSEDHSDGGYEDYPTVGGNPLSSKLLLTFSSEIADGRAAEMAFVISIRDYWQLQEYDFPIAARVVVLPDSVAEKMPDASISPEYILDSVYRHATGLEDIASGESATGSKAIRLPSQPQAFDSESRITLRRLQLAQRNRPN